MRPPRLPVALALLLSAGPAAAQTPLLADSFDYPDGPVNGRNGGTGAWTAGWNNGANTVSVSGGKLTASSAVSTFRNVDPTATAWASDGASVYLSATASAVNGSSLAVAAVGVPGGFLAIGGGVKNGQFILNGVPLGAGTGTATPGVEYQIVIRVTRHDGGNDEAALWVNPTAVTDAPLVTNMADYLPAGTTGLDVAIPFFDGGGGTIDDFRVGTTFESVTVAPEPATCTLLAAAAVGAAGGVRRLRRRVGWAR